VLTRQLCVASSSRGDACLRSSSSRVGFGVSFFSKAVSCKTNPDSGLTLEISKTKRFRCSSQNETDLKSSSDEVQVSPKCEEYGQQERKRESTSMTEESSTSKPLAPVMEDEQLKDPPSKAGEAAPESVCESTMATSTTTGGCSSNAEEEDDADYFADVGFMFDDPQSTKRECFQWKQKNNGRTVTVVLHVAAHPQDDHNANAADDNQESTCNQEQQLSSGHSLSPAAPLLAEYLIAKCNDGPTGDCYYSNVRTVVELGAGCALASLTALQVWQDTLQCVAVTDRDNAVLVRACDNLETTIQHIVDSVEDKSDDDALNMAINSVASIPVQFEALEWGDRDAVNRVANVIQEHAAPTRDYDEDAVPPSMSSLSSLRGIEPSTVDVVLGSDLIVDATAVEPLLQTAAQLMGSTGRFLLAQSVRWEAAVEEEMERMCRELSLRRSILQEDSNGVKRILEFVEVSTTGEDARA